MGHGNRRCRITSRKTSGRPASGFAWFGMELCQVVLLTSPEVGRSVMWARGLHFAGKAIGCWGCVWQDSLLCWGGCFGVGESITWFLVRFSLDLALRQKASCRFISFAEWRVASESSLNKTKTTTDPIFTFGSGLEGSQVPWRRPESSQRPGDLRGGACI